MCKMRAALDIGGSLHGARASQGQWSSLAKYRRNKTKIKKMLSVFKETTEERFLFGHHKIKMTKKTQNKTQNMFRDVRWL